ncbi:preprotein translocase subunit SecG [Noviherbaspirillum massiliense]|uniref:preprotein translocase subunit SecG n=1 Tax=Noviherbaspirillum massiliense TaxID=1465823 RepID=UPI000946DAC2|nr:preprotein translocase subunit SecG [Noviherbaspirillum massiliense]
MNTLFTLIVVIQVLAALTIVGLVLLQHGKGADMGAAFGSGASGSLFGASGSSNFLSKSTAVAAAIFFAATLALAFIGNKHSTAGGGVMENLPVQTPNAPAVPSSAAPAGVGSSAPANGPENTAGAPSASAGSSEGGAGQVNQIPK